MRALANTFLSPEYRNNIYSILSDPLFTGIVSCIAKHIIEHSSNLNSSKKLNHRLITVIACGTTLTFNLILGCSLQLSILKSALVFTTVMIQDYILEKRNRDEVNNDRQVNILTQDVPDQTIPERWEDDLILKKFICCITLTPTTCPAEDGETSHIYDSKALFSWILKNKNSPITHQSLDPLNICFLGLDFIEELIYYRLNQLKSYEENMKCQLQLELNPDHLQWMKESAEELDREIQSYTRLSKEELEAKFDMLSEIPPFLRGKNYYWTWYCQETGKPICHPLSPKSGEDLLSSNSSYVEIYYEKAVIESLFESDPIKPPKGWPKELSFTKENLRTSRSMSKQIKDRFMLAINELRRYYDSL